MLRRKRTFVFMYLYKPCWENTRETGIVGQFWGEQRGWQLGAERRFLFLIVCVCLRVGSACVCRFLKSPEVGVRAPAGGVTEWSCEQPSTGAGTQMWSSANAVLTLNHWDIHHSSSPNEPFPLCVSFCCFNLKCCWMDSAQWHYRYRWVGAIWMSLMRVWTCYIYSSMLTWCSHSA